MSRPRKPRLVRCDVTATYFKPRGIPLRDLDELTLGVDGLEAMRLADVDGLDQTAAAALMGISRSTFSRLVAEARRTVATALTAGLAIRIEGGPVARPSDDGNDDGDDDGAGRCRRRPALPVPALASPPIRTDRQGVRSMKQILAIPSDAPGGLAAAVSGHFGHCDAFTLVALADGAIETVSVMATPDHAAGGCLLPVRLLAEAGVTAIATAGIGRRPLLAILDTAIPLYSAAGLGSVGDVAAAFAGGRLPAFMPDGCCGDHDHDHGDGHGHDHGGCAG